MLRAIGSLRQSQKIKQATIRGFDSLRPVSMVHSTTPSPDHDSSRWKQIYEGALLEPDRAKLPERVAQARAAIPDRAEKILTVSLGDEHRALNHALRVLQLLEEAATRE